MQLLCGGGAKEELKVIEVFGSLQHALALALARARNGGVKICTNFGPPKRPKPMQVRSITIITLVPNRI
jgi:hypothetical protein